LRYREKKIPLPRQDEESLKKYLRTQDFGNLISFLNAFQDFMPVVIGDKSALERIAYEFCETQSKLNILYTELRYSPHYFSNTARNFLWDKFPPYHGKGDLTPEQTVEAVNKGLLRGRTDFGVHVYSILCCMEDHPEWSKTVLDICTKLRNEGVVGIDQAGANTGFSEQAVRIFEEAERRGIFRTAHAGETGSADCVKQELHVNRIGHGYRVFRDLSVYDLAKKKNIHFEICPLSSVMTGAVSNKWDSHPVHKLLEDKGNFSINTDDPTLLGNDLNSEFQLCAEKLGFTPQDFFHVVSSTNCLNAD
uniref:Adenosine deaminase n=1 Tax=Soboliphyme baturini TaxID=241478 RepID=A0A183J5Z9_9BILA